MKAAIECEATEVFRVATECGYGLTKGSESPLTTGAAMLASTIPNRVSSESHECSHSNGRVAFEVDEIIVSRLEA